MALQRVYHLHLKMGCSAGEGSSRFRVLSSLPSLSLVDMLHSTVEGLVLSGSFPLVAQSFLGCLLAWTFGFIVLCAKPLSRTLVILFVDYIKRCWAHYSSP